MANIPYDGGIDARSGRSRGARLTNAYDADSFGAGSARGMIESGRAVQDVGEGLRNERQRKEQQEALYGEALFDPSGLFDKVKGEVNEDAEGYKQRVKVEYSNEVETYLNGFEDDNVRTELRQRLMARMPAYLSQAQAYQSKVQEDTSKSNTNVVLDKVKNRVMSDPSFYDTGLAMGAEAIDLYGPIPAHLKADMKKNLEYDLSKTRFEAQLSKAKNVNDLDSVALELNTDEWRDKLNARDYEDLTGKVMSAKKAYQQQVNSEAKALLSGLESRSKDPQNIIPQEELVQAQKAASESGDISSQQRLARVVRDQQIVRSERKLTPAQMRQRMEETKGQDASPLPPKISEYVNNTTNKYPGISSSYLTATVMREFRGELSKPNPDYGKKNPEPNATSTGIMQFTDGTFANLLKDDTVAKAIGVTEGMTDAQKLELRKDPEKAIIAGAILAKQNKAQMENTLGRGVSDAELYMAHFLGAPEAIRFLKSREAMGDSVAADAFPDAAKYNKNVFHDKEGNKLSFNQVYQNVVNDFATATTRVAYDDNQVREKMLTSMEQSLNGGDGMKYAASVGVVSLVPLDQEGGFAARGKALQTANAYYGRQLKPFTVDEEAYMQRVINEGKTDDVVAMMQSVQQMGPDGARAAFDQLKIKSPAFAHAGALALDGDQATAADVVRGFKRMKDNPAIITSMGVKEEMAAQQFDNTVGGALSRIRPADRQAAQEAAMAYLVETQGAAGKKYDNTAYKQAIERVLGGRIDKVNGEKTYLPAGIKASDMRVALRKMDLQDYIGMSVNGSTPKHQDGADIDPRDMEDEVILRAVGGDKYALVDGEGGFLVTSKTAADGYPEKFIIELNTDNVRRILTRTKK